MASRFWVGGTGTWDAATTTHWSATSNGAGGASVPGSSDTVTFDASSGGGTVTVNTTVTVSSITMGAFTGALDFSANNNNCTLSATSAAFSITGTGVRTLNLGSGTFDLTSSTGNILWSAATTTNLTFNSGTSTIKYSGAYSTPATFAGGGLTYATVLFAANTSRGGVIVSGNNTFGTLSVAAPQTIMFTGGSTQTITAFSFTGGAYTAPIGILSSTTSAATISSASTPTFDWMAFRGITFSGGGTFAATDSYDLGLNTGITITGPAPTAGAGNIASRTFLGM